jgi:hypothetical protein
LIEIVYQSFQDFHLIGALHPRQHHGVRRGRQTNRPAERETSGDDMRNGIETGHKCTALVADRSANRRPPKAFLFQIQHEDTQDGEDRLRSV